MKTKIKEKTLKIEIPEGYEIDRENSSFEEIVFIPINPLPKTWEEFCNNHLLTPETDYYIHIDSSIMSFEMIAPRDYHTDRNFLPSRDLARATRALCQLIQLRDCYNGQWKPNWSNPDENKYVIYPYDDYLNVKISTKHHYILAFKTLELRSQFLENFENLIEIAKPLL